MKLLIIGGPGLRRARLPRLSLLIREVETDWVLLHSSRRVQIMTEVASIVLVDDVIILVDGSVDLLLVWSRRSRFVILF